MIKEFIFLFVCFISIFIYLLCSDKLCSARIMQFQQFDDISLKNFVYLWKEFQTPSGLKALKNTLGEQHNVETNCLNVLEELTELDFFPREEFTVDNENFMLKLCEGYLLINATITAFIRAYKWFELFSVSYRKL